MNFSTSIALVVAATALAIGLLALVRHRSPHGGHFSDTARATGVFTILATFYAVLFAFVVLFAFGAYDDAGDSAEVEAQTVLQQFETAQLLDSDQSALLSGQLRCYARSVIHQEWPAMNAGAAVGLNPWDVDLFMTLRDVEPSGAAAEVAYGQWLDQRSIREEARQNRELGEHGVIPGPVWFVVLLTAAIVWAFTFLFADRGEGALIQFTLIGTVTAMLVTSLLVVLFLDRPYGSGSDSLQPVAMEATLAQIEELAPLLGVELPDICDADGRPDARVAGSSDHRRVVCTPCRGDRAPRPPTTSSGPLRSTYAGGPGPLAQLVEQWTFNPSVVGSSPTGPTDTGGRSRPVRTGRTGPSDVRGADLVHDPRVLDRLDPARLVDVAELGVEPPRHHGDLAVGCRPLDGQEGLARAAADRTHPGSTHDLLGGDRDHRPQVDREVATRLTQREPQLVGGQPQHPCATHGRAVGRVAHAAGGAQHRGVLRGMGGDVLGEVEHDPAPRGAEPPPKDQQREHAQHCAERDHGQHREHLELDRRGRHRTPPRSGSSRPPARPSRTRNLA